MSDKEPIHVDDFITEFFLSFKTKDIPLKGIEEKVYEAYLKLDKKQLNFRFVMHHIHGDSLAIYDALARAKQRGLISIRYGNTVHINL